MVVMYKTLRNVVLATALGLGGYFAADSLLAKDPPKIEEKQCPEIRKYKHGNKTIRYIKFNELIKYPEYFRNVDMDIYHTKDSKIIKTDSGGEVEVGLYSAFSFDPEQIVGDNPYFKLEFSPKKVSENEIKMINHFHRIKTRNINGIKSLIDLLDIKYKAFTNSQDEIWEMFSEYESWDKNRPKKQDWKYSLFDDFDPKPTNFEPNEWDRHIDRTIGKRLKLKDWERNYLDKLFRDQPDLSPREAILHVKNKLKSISYKKHLGWEIKPIDKFFEEGGDCEDFTEIFCKIISYVKETNPKSVHLHSIPGNYYYSKFDSCDKYFGNHSVTINIHTYPAEISFMLVTRGDLKMTTQDILLK